MPNCDFYAAGEDYEPLITFVLNETSCRIYELSSAPGRRLRQFDSWASLREGTPSWPPMLQLWPLSANPRIRIRRIRVTGDEHHRKPYVREELEGWGLIQLYLAGPRGRSLSPSHTNHNTAARAARWASTSPELGPPSAWDFAAVTRESSRINRYLRSVAVGKEGSRLVLPGAAALFRVGVEPALQ